MALKTHQGTPSRQTAPHCHPLKLSIEFTSCQNHRSIHSYLLSDPFCLNVKLPENGLHSLPALNTESKKLEITTQRSPSLAFRKIEQCPLLQLLGDQGCICNPDHNPGSRAFAGSSLKQISPRFPHRKNQLGTCVPMILPRLKPDLPLINSLSKILFLIFIHQPVTDPRHIQFRAVYFSRVPL